MSDLMAAVGAAFGASLMGFAPVIIWLAFWLFEDWRHPEPRRNIIWAFVIGMISVPIVLSFEGLAASMLPYGYALLFSWAMIEEVVKLALAWIFVLRAKEVDEPLDFPVYLITVALGFAAIENSLFLFTPLLNNGFIETAITGNLRFIGPTLIHVLGAAIVGAALGFAFFRDNYSKMVYGFFGVILAATLHTYFNFLIITTGAGRVLTVFLGVWVAIIFVLLALERLKFLRPPSWWEKVVIRKTN